MSEEIKKNPQNKSERKLLLLVISSTIFFLFFPIFENLKQLFYKREGEILVKVLAQEIGGFNPSEITVTAREPLKLVFWAMDTTHSFNLPQIGIDLVLPAGEKLKQTILTDFKETSSDYTYLVNQRSFTIQKDPRNIKQRNPLVLDFKCNRYCSHQHWSMRGRIIVLPPKH